LGQEINANQGKDRPKGSHENTAAAESGEHDGQSPLHLRGWTDETVSSSCERRF